MGKLLKQQRRGKGSFAYSTPSHRYKTELKYPEYDEYAKTSMAGQVIGFIDDPARQAILMDVLLENTKRIMLLAPEGICREDSIAIGSGGQLALGSILPLSQIPDGAYIYNVEVTPGDGGKFVRTPGSFATIVSREGKFVLVKLPSKRLLNLPAGCRAQVGVVCGAGKTEKPIMKAGTNFFKKHAQNRLWPKVRGVKQSPYTHPFGGKQHHPGKSMSTSRNAPPGRKVGHIAARSTGRGGRKRKTTHFKEQ
ncbi:50S ribosomal protein L2 [Candidatus Micrarchaeota archaeon CG1_02_47_40]|nr:MAG: 50S ribosomal protein L2 [Candidatus Micrarchaeota archaeon CG1_02_47_40]